MENGPFSADAFGELAGRVVLFCHVTSGVADDRHAELLREKGGRGFPTLVYLDAEGDVQGRPPERSLEGIATGLRMSRRLSELDAENDPANAFERFRLRATLGMLDLEAARDAASRLGDLAEEQSKEVDAVILRLEIEALIREHGQLRAGKAMLALKEAGRVPEPDTREAFDFWLNLWSLARETEDIALAEEALAGLERAVGDKPTHRGMLDNMAATLRKLKEGRSQVP